MKRRKNICMIMIKLNDRTVNRLFNALQLWGNGVETDERPCIRGRIFIQRSDQGCIRIGRHCKINSALWANPVGRGVKTLLVTREAGSIMIGNGVGISNTTIYAYDSVIIEDNVRIGGGCQIYDSDFHSLDYSERIEGVNDIRRKPVQIREGAFIGADSTILKGVTVGRHAIVGAGSVVTHDIPDYEVWAGNPARRIRSIRVEEE